MKAPPLNNSGKFIDIFPRNTLMTYKSTVAQFRKNQGINDEEIFLANRALGGSNTQHEMDGFQGTLNRLLCSNDHNESNILYQKNEKNKVIAFLVQNITPEKIGNVAMIQVHDEYRHQGRATELLRISCGEFVKSGITARNIPNAKPQNWEHHTGEWKEKIEKIVKESGMRIVEGK